MLMFWYEMLVVFYLGSELDKLYVPFPLYSFASSPVSYLFFILTFLDEGKRPCIGTEAKVRKSMRERYPRFTAPSDWYKDR